MNEYWLKKLFPNASRSTVEANPQLHDPQPQRDKAPALGKAVPGEKEGVGRIVVSYRLFRVRPLDADNATGSTKDCTDGLCRLGLLPGDDPWSIELRVAQEKVQTYSEERTEITIEYPCREES